MGLLTDGPPGTPVVGDSWVKLLEYDLEMRKEMMARVEDGTTLKKALKEVPADPEVKMKYFTDPVQFKIRKKRSQPEATPSAPADVPEQPWKTFKGKDKGKGKGKDKGKGKNKGAGRPQKCKYKTKNGKQICFKFNQEGAWCPGGCGRAHVCGICFKANTPMFRCNHEKEGGGEPSG